MYELLESQQLALEYYSKAAQLESDDYRVYLALGNCHMQRGQTTNALSAYQRALTCPKAPVAINIKIGLAYDKVRRQSDALRYYRIYLDSSPSIFASPIDDSTLLSVIFSVAKDDCAKGDYLKANSLLSVLARSHGKVSINYQRPNSKTLGVC